MSRLKPEFEFVSDFKSLLVLPSIYADWEGIQIAIFGGWLFWHVKLEWVK